MADLKLPALDPSTVAEVRGSGYPEPFKSRMGDRRKRRLGEACGLTGFGVNLVTLPAGGQSALRHCHTREDEFVFILSGELVLITDAGEQTVGAGMCVGYAAGSGDAHHLVNRSRGAATYLEVGSRVAADECCYPDDDLLLVDRNTRYVHKDGSPYA